MKRRQLSAVLEKTESAGGPYKYQSIRV